ncbi:hypothetical protein HanPSC8_Chr01g0032571 [Helianthus annuus]|nr:hypothetical protein HanIR_Chr01g0036751 [Helianthus annuus]KAJ0957856.1 hypothetical protein HanPSC8_Chr01g0032571 [Helianthus annuus]
MRVWEESMMWHVAVVGETYAKTPLEDFSWNFWLSPYLASTSTSNNPSTSDIRHQGHAGGSITCQIYLQWLKWVVKFFPVFQMN